MFTILVAILPFLALIKAERNYDNIIFSEDLCKQLGHEHDFDVCAKIEYCRGDDDERRRILGDKQDVIVGEEELNKEFHQEVKQAKKESQESKGPKIHQATRGWRIPGGACLAPGPIMRLRRGLKHGLFAAGNGDPTNLHFHGLHIAGHGNADNFHRSVGENDIIIYSIDLPADKHLGGTHWYHSHMEGKSLDQVQDGAFGMIVVSDNDEDVGTSDMHVLEFLEKEKVLVVDNANKIWKANGIEASSSSSSGLGETLNFVKDEWYRLKILMVGVDSHSASHQLKFGLGCETMAIAHDGIMRFKVPGESSRRFILTPSSRLDLAIKCRKDVDIRVEKNVIARIVTDSSKAPSSASPYESGKKRWHSLRLAYTEDLRKMNASNTWSIRLYETNLNGVNSAEERPLCDEDGNDFEYGSIQEWSIRDSHLHPFHLHMYPMQVVAGCGLGHDVGEYYDTITAIGSGKYCIVRVRMVDVAGPALMHCHIFLHAGQGSLGYINVIGGPTQASEPSFLTCKSGEACNQHKKPDLCSDLDRN